MIKMLMTFIESLLRGDPETEESAEQVDGRFFSYMTGEAVDLPTADGIYDVDIVDEKWVDDLRG